MIWQAWNEAKINQAYQMERFLVHEVKCDATTEVLDELSN
jgi:hypothetical protein